MGRGLALTDVNTIAVGLGIRNPRAGRCRRHGGDEHRLLPAGALAFVNGDLESNAEGKWVNSGSMPIDAA